MEEIAPIVTIDGPSAVGKGTLCKSIAEILKWNLLDSGIMYRMAALVMLYYHVDITVEKEILSLLTYLNLYLCSINEVFRKIYKHENISKKIKSQEVADAASRIAIFPCVRSALLHSQRSFSRSPGLIADGRDMGTIVFPDAPVKIFLNASLEKRAYYRMLQLQKTGSSVSFKRLVSEIQERDDRDKNRAIAPLIPAKDAIILDSTNLTIEQLTEKALQYIRQKLFLV